MGDGGQRGDTTPAARLNRRQFLHRAGLFSAGLAALPLLAACGGGAATPTVPAAPPAPASGGASPAAGGARPTASTRQYSGALQLLQWSSFVPAADAEIKRQGAEWGKQHGVAVTIETVNGNDLQTKTSAAVQSKSGPDIIQMQYNWPWLYDEQCADVSQVYGDLAKQLGGYYDVMEAYCKVDGTPKAIPYAIVSNAWVYRADWLQAIGKAAPTTFQELHDTGKALKAKNQPMGQALGHSYGDANTMWYGFLWSYGGREVEQDGKTVAINSPETLAAVEAAVALYNDAFDPGVLSWDDGSNNRAFLGEQISATLNGASIYITAKEQNPDLAKTIVHGLPLKGPKDQAIIHLNLSHAVMAYSQHQDAARDLLYWLMQPEQYNRWLQASGGYNVGVLHAYDDNPVWRQEPGLTPYRDSVQFGRWPGWPGPPARPASEALARYLIVDMFAKACQGTAPKDAIAATEAALKQVYGG
ncbi:MAG TPA: extracellular solute-binding protein [Thermomicrobiales bacterium]|nr:extracellular solute-binding protein [Thermomicrobiales bacterium]